MVIPVFMKLKTILGGLLLFYSQTSLKIKKL